MRFVLLEQPDLVLKCFVLVNCKVSLLYGKYGVLKKGILVSADILPSFLLHISYESTSV